MTEPVKRLALESGLDRIEEWSAAAGQTEQNLVYEALFGIVDGSAFWTYLTVVEAGGDGDLSVYVRQDLVLRIRLTETGGFEVLSIGAGTLAEEHDADPGRQA